MTKFSNKLKKLFLVHFESIFPILEAKKIFLENPTVMHNSHGILAPYQNLEKTNDTIPRKRPDRQKDGQTLFYRTLPATTGAPMLPSQLQMQSNNFYNETL